ncbi:MAG: GIY-YIG nuclease family protein [Bacteroidetes bacterium]|nr:GIY-YIG nuclease family protein [Bacteroidota bacterium]
MEIKKWKAELETSLVNLSKAKEIPYNTLQISTTPKCPGVYMIVEKERKEILYIGESNNLSERLYRNHLMGNKSSANFKKKLVNDNTLMEVICNNTAKKFLKDKCSVKWILEDEFIKRKAIECYITALLLPKYAFTEKIKSI